MITGNEKAMPEITTDKEFAGDSIYGNTYSYGGLTIRQHFASMAMQGLLSNPSINKLLENIDDGFKHESIAVTALLAADALITQLNKPNP